jgi:hypothetical protein
MGLMRQRSAVLVETTVMELNIWDIRVWLFDNGLSAIKQAYSESRSSMERDKESAKQDWQKHLKRIAAGDDQTLYEDDATGQTFDFGEYIGEQISNADETLRIVREAFLLSLYHYWEKQVRGWMKVKDYKQDKALPWLTAEGLTPDKNNLDVLRMAANCIKHNNQVLYKRYPKFFDASRIVGPTPDLHDALRIDDEHLDVFFHAVRASGPQPRRN